jgi:prophage regulatory protein
MTKVSASVSGRLLSYRDLKSIKGVRWSRQWIAKQIAAGKFPKPISLGENSRCFLESEVDAFILSRIQDRDRA